MSEYTTTERIALAIEPLVSETALDQDEEAINRLCWNIASTALAVNEPRRVGWPVDARFQFGDRVRKTRGSSWQGRVVGFYSTKLTPIGYNVESEREPGSVQLWPDASLGPVEDSAPPTPLDPASIRAEAMEEAARIEARDPTPTEMGFQGDPICRRCATQERGSPLLSAYCCCGDHPSESAPYLAGFSAGRATAIRAAARDGFQRADFAHTAKMLRKQNEQVTRAVLSNNINIIIAALDRAAASASEDREDEESERHG